MQIFVYRQHGNLGPYSMAELGTQLATGVVRPEDLAWHEGLSQWEPVSSLLRLTIATPSLPESSEQVDDSAERTRKKYLSHEANVRSLGILYYVSAGSCLLLGAFNLGLLLIVLISKPSPGHNPLSILEHVEKVP